ncbi:MAG: TrkH family potassium uptake protein [Verrucomicrobia bacterium]|jgi:trk system potassium uptake protein|nr:TrkH family potassium uptake protein [Verrucomicrobiota bacterium]MBT7700157.1 TrkH family potassium uptake protein [Verrucomicrobiota bacterium]
MNLRPVLHLISIMLAVLGLAIGLCAGIAWLYADPWQARIGMLAASGIVLATGILLFVLTRGPVDLSRRDGFGIVTFGWLAAAILGSLPFMLTGVITDPAAALFETMSGFTTTGASVLSDLEAVPRGVMFWRAMTHFFGGMGVLVLCVAILPFLGVGGMQIYRAEMPGPSKDRLTPRIATTAKLLWGVYVFLCVAEAALLRLGGMDWFDAFCHAFATMATGGFSTRTASVAAYNSAYIESVIIVFMFLAGTNFALNYRALLGRPLCYFRDPEFRFYLGAWLTATVVIILNIYRTVYPSFGQAVRAAFFQSTSIMTTTGFCTEDFDLWPGGSKVILVLLMFIGGCAGSTGGGMKNIRVLVVLKKVVREITLFMQPQAVVKVKIGREPVPQEVISHISAFFILFVLVFAGGSLVMTLFTPDLQTAVTSVIATLGNIGPGLGGVGAVQNYSAIPTGGKLFLTLFMLLGRLELYTVLIVLLPGFWKK